MTPEGDEGAPIPPAAWRVLHLPLRFGGLGLRSAAEAAQSAWWASWFDSLPAIRVRAPDVAERLVQGLEAQGGSEPPSLVSARTAAALLRGRVFEVPPWDSFSPVPPGDGERDDPLRGWQRRAAMVCDERALEMHLSDLDTASRALVLSQAGPHAGRALTVRPTATELLIPPDPAGPVPGAAPTPPAVPAAAFGCLVPGSGRAGVPQRAPGRYECRCAHRGRTSH